MQRKLTLQAMEMITETGNNMYYSLALKLALSPIGPHSAIIIIRYTK